MQGAALVLSHGFPLRSMVFFAIKRCGRICPFSYSRLYYCSCTGFWFHERLGIL